MTPPRLSLCCRRSKRLRGGRNIHDARRDCDNLGVVDRGTHPGAPAVLWNHAHHSTPAADLGRDCENCRRHLKLEIQTASHYPRRRSNKVEPASTHVLRFHQKFGSRRARIGFSQADAARQAESESAEASPVNNADARVILLAGGTASLSWFEHRHLLLLATLLRDGLIREQAPSWPSSPRQLQSAVRRP